MCRSADVYSDIVGVNSVISVRHRRYSQRLTYTCLSSIPCSMVWKQTIQRASNHFQLSHPCSGTTPNLIWRGKTRWGLGLEEDSQHVTQTMSIMLIIAHGRKVRMAVCCADCFSSCLDELILHHTLHVYQTRNNTEMYMDWNSSTTKPQTTQFKCKTENEQPFIYSDYLQDAILSFNNFLANTFSSFL